MTTNKSDNDTVQRNLKQNYLKERTKRFALEIIQLVEKLPKGRTADILGRQLLAAGTSAGANPVLHAGQDLLQISFQRWVLLKKRLMSQYTGWNCLLIVD